MRMDGERRTARRTAAIAGLLAIVAAGAAQADAPGSARSTLNSALTGGAPIYGSGGAHQAPIYSPGDRPPVALYGQSAPLTTGPIYDPSMPTGATSTAPFATGPIYDPYAATAYAPPIYAPTYQAPPQPPAPPWAKQNDVFGYAPSAACGGLLEGERCLVILGDHTRRVRLDREASTILVGNPAVADVTVLSKRTMFVSARSVGSTNIVALDENEEEIASWEVFVREPEAKRVTLRQGPTRENYQCAPYCERSLSQNDSPGAHGSHLGVISAEMGLDRSAAGTQSGGPPPEAFADQEKKPMPPAAPATNIVTPTPPDAAALNVLRSLMTGAGGLPPAQQVGATPAPSVEAPPPDYTLN